MQSVAFCYTAFCYEDYILFFFHIKELQALAQKKAELQRKIEEMEKVVREQQENEQKSGTQVI